MPDRKMTFDPSKTTTERLEALEKSVRDLSTRDPQEEIRIAALKNRLLNTDLTDARELLAETSVQNSHLANDVVDERTIPAAVYQSMTVHPLKTWTAGVGGSLAAGRHWIGNGGVGTGLVSAPTVTALNLDPFHWEPANFAPTGKTAGWYLDTTLMCNGTAIAADVSIGIMNHASVAGGVGVITTAEGTRDLYVAGHPKTVSTINNSATLAAAPAEGMYSAYIYFSGAAVSANSREVVSVTLYRYYS